MRIVIGLASMLVAACTTPHNDVLMFGTNTSMGVDIGVQPETGGSPKVSIGYKRQEAVYMPLVMNARGSVFGCASISDGICNNLRTEFDTPWQLQDLQYTGLPEGASTGGTARDAYSVFASFGGRASGRQGEAGMSVAQFFATGIAAQRLGASPNVASLVSTEAGDVEAQRKIAELQRQLGAARIDLVKADQAALDESERIKEVREERIDAISNFIQASPDAATRSTRIETLVSAIEGSQRRTQLKSALEQTENLDEIKDVLNRTGYLGYIESIHDKLPD